MQPAADAMAEALGANPPAAPLVPVVANVTAAPVSDADTIRDLLVSQVTGRVRWRESVRAMEDIGVDRFVEIGGKVLSPMVKRSAGGEVETVSVISMDDIEALLKAFRIHAETRRLQENGSTRSQEVDVRPPGPGIKE